MDSRLDGAQFFFRQIYSVNAEFQALLKEKRNCIFEIRHFVEEGKKAAIEKANGATLGENEKKKWNIVENFPSRIKFVVETKNVFSAFFFLETRRRNFWLDKPITPFDDSIKPNFDIMALMEFPLTQYFLQPLSSLSRPGRNLVQSFLLTTDLGN